MNDSESNRFQRVMELFEAARLIQGTDRDAFLEETCRENPDVLNEVRRLLSVHDKENGPLDSPILHESARPAEAVGITPPKRIDRYRVKHQIGAGGMGAVYLAEQDNPRRDVAVKVIRPGLFSRDLLRRFELEAAVLGRLDHSGIAQIYEAGMFDDELGSRPFFAMEYVDGPPLLEFVNRRHLELPEMLELFASICDAVHHAHQKGIVHRDLKPGNILVRNDGQPKILDFGVARATDFGLQLSTIQTGMGQLIGTLQYMSPEQVEGNVRSVDTRSDVYALGVVLYEMLAGVPPYDLKDRTIANAARIIVDTQPTPLSTISKTFRGDLNTIVLTAIEKDPTLRYQSASDFAVDIRRYLNDQPIAARPASTLYQLRKFAHRNKALVGGVVAVFLVLVAGFVGTSWGMLLAQRQRDEAQVQTRVAEAVNDFINDDLLSKANPYIRSGTDVKLRDVLDEAAARIESRFPDQPAVEAALRKTIGDTYYGLGEYQSAELHYRRACQLFQALGDIENQIDSSLELAGALIIRAPLDEAEKVVLRNIELAELHLGKNHLQSARAHQHLAIVFRRQGRYEEAESEYRRAIEINDAIAASRSLNKEEQEGVIKTKNNFAVLLSLQQRPEQAEQLLRQVVDDWDSLVGRRNFNTAYALNNLGDALWRQEKLEEAEKVFREALDIRRELLGEDHPDTLVSKYAIGLIETDTGQYQAAERTMRHVMEAREKFLDPTNWLVLIAKQAVGVALENQDHNEEAAQVFREVLVRAYPVYGPGSRTQKMRDNLIKTLRKLEALDEVAGVYVEHSDWLVKSLESDGLTEKEWAQNANTLARLLLTCESELVRDSASGLHWALAAIDAEGDQPQFLNTLALAYAENGQLQLAVTTQQRALSLLAGEKIEKTRQQFEKSLARYLQLLDQQ